MNIAAYCDWSIDGDDIAFFDEEFARFVAEFADLWFGDRAARAQLRNGSEDESVTHEIRRRGWCLLV